MSLTAKGGNCKICGKHYETVKKVERRYEDYQPYDEDVYYPSEKSDVITVYGVGGYICRGCYSKSGKAIKEKILERANMALNFTIRERANIEEKYKQMLEREIHSIEKHKTEIELVKGILEVEGKIDRDKLKAAKGEIKDFYIGSMLEDIRHIINWEDSYYYDKKQAREFEEEFELEIIKYPKDINSYTMITKEEFLDFLLNSRVENKTAMEILDLIDKERIKM